MSRIQGTVKWFSNKKGYGFIEPTSDNATTKEDVFVHQSSVESGGYRTLVDGWVVEFEIVTDADGKLKADNVTAPGGGPCTGPRPPRREKKPTEGEPVPEAAVPITTDATTEQTKKKKKKKKPSASANGKKKASTKAQGQRWHDILNDEVKESLTAKGIRHATGTVDIAIDKQRIKLGTRGYVSMAHGDAILAEGTFIADENGVVTLTWEHVLKFVDGEWKGATADGIIGTFTLTDGNVASVDASETPGSLWGEDKPDPKDALAKEGFQMRRVVLTPKVGNEPKKAEE